jgi:glycosyltransferase involved in cell wall biosynthesis
VRLAVVSTYAPKACGIAVFSGDLRTAMLAANRGCRVDVVAMIDEGVEIPTAPEVLTTIARNDPDSYRAAAELLGSTDVDVVVIEHEFGLFGGPAGDAVLELAQAVRQPLVVTLHTVLSEPSPEQLSVLRRLCALATVTTVFTQTARRMIAAEKIAPVERVAVVPHGAPDLLLSSPAAEDYPGRRVLSTFGLISAGKGIETAVAALPKIVARHPEVIYLVVGQTHPDVVRHDGESYRDGLARLVTELELSEHVRFVDGFADIAEIARLLAGTAIYLTPYRSREQIVSGALTFAVAAGCPVVSTPYFYAEDLLGSGAGVLVPFEDPDALSSAVLDLLDDPARLAAARIESRRIGSGLAWSQVAIDTLEVLRAAMEAHERRERTEPEVMRSGAWPAPKPDHLLTLVDDVGILEHASGAVPQLAGGYCVDDVARLAVVSSGLLRASDDAHNDLQGRRTLTRALAFLAHAYDPSSGALHNILGYDRRWADEPHDGDHLGRTVWALGAVLADHPRPELTGATTRLLTALTPALAASTSPRSVAYGLIGLALADGEALPDEAAILLEPLANRLLAWHEQARRPGWPWFEPYLTYDNARLPQALLLAGRRTGSERCTRIGLETLDWYSAQCHLDGGFVRLVGNRWRFPPAADDPPLDLADREGDEQPLDAAALTEALMTAYDVTGQEHFAELARRAFSWFLGRNRLGLPVYDERTGGCHDGLGATALNANLGAESTLAFFQGYLAVRPAMPDQAP